MIWLAVAAYILIGFYLSIRWTLYWHERENPKNAATTDIWSAHYAAGGGMALVWPVSLVVSAAYQAMRKIISRRYAPAATLSALGEIGEKDKNTQAEPDWEALYKNALRASQAVGNPFATAPPWYSSVTTNIGGNSGSSTSH